MKKFLTVLLVLSASTIVMAYNLPGLLSYEVQLPKGVLTQGDQIHVSYIIDALNWRLDNFLDPDIPGVVIQDVKTGKYRNSDGSWRLVVNCVFSLIDSGPVTLPRLNLTIDGKPFLPAPSVLVVLPNPKYGHEWMTARDFLVSRGWNPKRLQPIFSYETMYAFSDTDEKLFVIVARKNFEPFLDNPVIAYGSGNSIWDGVTGESDNSIASLLSTYSSQLKYLRDSGIRYSPSFPATRASEKAGPLMGDICLGQTWPFNAKFPKVKYQDKDSTCLAGCGAVALSEVLSYYKAPFPLSGKGYLKTVSGSRTDVDYNNFQIKWDGSEDDYSSLLLCAAATLNEEVGPKGSSSRLCDFKAALLNDWRYSPYCTFIDDCDDRAMISQVYSELKNKRPVIVADDKHVFICDGFDKDFLHLDFGWEGYCNGYYRVILVDSFKDRQLSFNEILLGATPFPPEQYGSLEIKVKKPGTIGKRLDAARKKLNGKELTTLKVSGKINGKDIACLREMATSGSLMDLDLSKAKLLAGGCYFRQNANKMTFTGTVVSLGTATNYKFDMASISDREWKQMNLLGLASGENWVLKRDSDDNFIISWFAENGIIGQSMFYGCQNLCRLSLPSNIRQVKSQAFSRCHALRHVDGLPKETASDAFDSRTASSNNY